MRLYCTSILLLIFQLTSFSQPSNDECNDATLLTCGTELIGESTVNSTDNGDALGCNPGVGVWYKIEPSTSQTYELVISNPTFNNEISIAEGTTSCGGFINLYCKVTGTFDRKHYFYGEAGKKYYVFFGSFLNSSSSGTFDIKVNCLIPPENVSCSTATILACGDNLTNQSSINSVDYGDPLGCETGIGVWYKFTPSVSETIEVIVENSTFNYKIALAEGSSCDNFVNLQCKPASANSTKLVFYGEEGKEYYIYVGDLNNSGQVTGTFDISITCLTPPINFSCATATILSCDTLIVESSVGAVDNNDIIGSCSIGVATWYSFTPTVNNTIELSISDLDFTSEIAIVEGNACGSFNVLQCNQIYTNRTNKVVFAGTADQTYYFVIGDDIPSGVKTGTFNISVDCLMPPSNDLCVNARSIVCGDVLIDESSVGSTDHGYISNCNVGVGVWYTFTSMNSDAYEIEVSNPSFDMIYTVYSSADCISFTRLKCHNISSTSSPNYIFQATADINYYIYVGDRSNGTDSGTFDISIQCYDPAPNSNCAGAKSISCGDSFIEESTEGAISNILVSGCSTGLGLWYKYSSPDSMTTMLSINNPTSNMKYRIFSSSDCINFTNIFCNSIFKNGSQKYIFLAEPAVDYYIFVGNTNSSTTEYFDFDIILECLTPATNIDCSSATDLECGIPLINQSTTGGIDNGPSSSSGGVGTWYQFTAQVTETVTIRIDNATEDFIIQAASSSDCENFIIKQAKSSFNSTDSIVFAVDQGLDYYVFIGDKFQFGTTYFDFDIEISCNTALSNNICLEATELNCGDNLIGESTLGATDNGDDLSCFTGVGVWYKYIPDAHGTAFVSVTPDPNYDISVAVASSEDCVSFTNVLCSQVFGDGVKESFDFAFSSGVSYYIYVADRANNGTAFGSFDLSITCAFCPEDYNGPNSLSGMQSGTSLFETNGLIESTQMISNNATVNYDSRTGILLSEGFEVTEGAIFQAYIDGCGEN